jgi:hypothetical protein
MLGMTLDNPFEKSPDKNSQLTVTLTAQQRQVVEALRDHLGLRTNTAVAVAGLSALYEKHKRQLTLPDPAAEPSAE